MGPNNNWQPIRDFSGKILAWIEIDSQGCKTIRAFSGKILGKYDPKRDVTSEFSGRVVGKGDLTGLFIGKE